MLDPFYTTVWDASLVYEQYRLPLKSGSVVGNVITIQSRNHWLETADIVNVTCMVAGYEAFTATNVSVTKIDEDNFSYTVVSPPGEFPNPRPGLSIVLWLTCDKYSVPLVNPERVRMNTVPTGTLVAVQTRNPDLTWKTERTVSNIDGVVDFVFVNAFKEARFMRWSGVAVPRTIALSSGAEPLSPPPNHVYEIPGDILSSGGGGTEITTGVFAGATNVYTTAPTTIDSFSIPFRSARYQIQVSDNIDFETSEVLLIHNGISVYLSERGNVFTTANSLGTFDAYINAGIVYLTYVAVTATTKTIRFIRTTLNA